MERLLGARDGEKEKKNINGSVNGQHRAGRTALHATRADLEPGTSASDCSSA